MTIALDLKSPLHAYSAPSFGYKLQIFVAFSLMIGIPLFCILINQGGLLRLVFPMLSCAVGGFLIWRSKPLFVGLVFWLWFITPFVGRIADMQGGWTEANPVAVAPYITAGLAVLPLLSNLQCLRNRIALPYVCAIASILYGLIIGLRYLPLFNVLRSLLDWTVPIVFGLFIYENRRFYPQFARVIEKSFLYGLLLMGAYGIYQFFGLLDWDREWMLNVHMNSFGQIDPMKTRVFSTMNSPPVFAAVAACGLLLLFNMKERLKPLAAAFGFISVVFTLSRAAWLSLALGFAFLGYRLGKRSLLRLSAAFVACIAFLFGMMQVHGVNDVVEERMRTFVQPGHDLSYTARVEGHEQAFFQIAHEPWGEGVGSTDTLHNTEGDDDFIGPHDSTLLEFFYSLGWIGTVIYVLGILLLGVQLVQRSRSDLFVVSAQAIMIAFLGQCLLNSVLLGPIGFMVWTFASMILSAAEYEQAAYAVNEPESVSTELAGIKGVGDASFAHPE